MCPQCHVGQQGGQQNRQQGIGHGPIARVKDGEGEPDCITHERQIDERIAAPTRQRENECQKYQRRDHDPQRTQQAQIPRLHRAGLGGELGRCAGPALLRLGQGFHGPIIGRSRDQVAGRDPVWLLAEHPDQSCTAELQVACRILPHPEPCQAAVVRVALAFAQRGIGDKALHAVTRAAAFLRVVAPPQPDAALRGEGQRPEAQACIAHQPRRQRGREEQDEHDGSAYAPRAAWEAVRSEDEPRRGHEQRGRSGQQQQARSDAAAHEGDKAAPARRCGRPGGCQAQHYSHREECGEVLASQDGDVDDRGRCKGLDQPRQQAGAHRHDLRRKKCHRGSGQRAQDGLHQRHGFGVGTPRRIYAGEQGRIGGRAIGQPQLIAVLARGEPVARDGVIAGEV